MKNISEYDRSSDRHLLNLGPLKYEAGVLTIRDLYLVLT